MNRCDNIQDYTWHIRIIIISFSFNWSINVFVEEFNKNVLLGIMADVYLDELSTRSESAMKLHESIIAVLLHAEFEIYKWISRNPDVGKN